MPTDPTPTDTSGPPAPTPPSAPTPSPASPPASSSAPTTNVSVAYPVSVFKSGVDGVPDILSTPTAVPTSSLSAIQEAAAASFGVTIVVEEQS